MSRQLKVNRPRCPDCGRPLTKGECPVCTIRAYYKATGAEAPVADLLPKLDYAMMQDLIAMRRQSLTDKAEQHGGHRLDTDVGVAEMRMVVLGYRPKKKTFGG